VSRRRGCYTRETTSLLQSVLLLLVRPSTETRVSGSRLARRGWYRHENKNEAEKGDANENENEKSERRGPITQSIDTTGGKQAREEGCDKGESLGRRLPQRFRPFRGWRSFKLCVCGRWAAHEFKVFPMRRITQRRIRVDVAAPPTMREA
jgi:hypothetical protein